VPAIREIDQQAIEFNLLKAKQLENNLNTDEINTSFDQASQSIS